MFLTHQNQKKNVKKINMVFIIDKQNPIVNLVYYHCFLIMKVKSGIIKHQTTLIFETFFQL